VLSDARLDELHLSAGSVQYHTDWAGCVVADLKLPGMSGVELQASLRANNCSLPCVIITGHGDIKSARGAFQLGAVDFLEKPFDDADLCAAIEKGLARESRRIEHAQIHSNLTTKLAKLTQREREVLKLVGEGLHAKEIARALSISARTVEVYKAHLMTKLELRNVSELVRFSVIVEES